ncbi:substrate-binding domain-containing protein [Paenibacillus chitinolyticus]|uniref:substrate-binding domain-containing protein n=1 Tax=Paenibacillus chitinolyticus TaxID=79263 RepID=UPI003647EEBB
MRRLGFSIPGDLGITGFDKTEVAHLLDLTTIDYPVVQQAENAFSILQNRWNNTNNGLNTLSYKLVERKST